MVRHLRETVFVVALTVALGLAQPVWAQMVVKDYQTNTTITSGGSSTLNISTSTTENNTAFNSFSRFNVYDGYTVNLVRPSSATNLINLVQNEISLLDGHLRTINTSGLVAGNSFFVNPLGFTVSSTAQVEAGSVTFETPTQEFMANFFEGWANPSDAATSAVLNGTLAINPNAQIILDGAINASVTSVYGDCRFAGSVSGDFSSGYATTFSGTGTRSIGGELLASGRLSVDAVTVQVGDDLQIDGSGYIIATSGSRIVVGGSLVCASTRPDLWDTRGAELVLPSGPHTLHLAGGDLGPGGDNGFAWGTLTLESGAGLALMDAVSPAGAALYLDVLALADGLAQIPSITGNGFNIYYDPSNPANAYLGGASYPLTNGGAITPIPEPAGLLLLVTALPLAMRRRRNAA
ncbi:MAG: leukotoxin LktA family filamentous adhesin [Planctomycetaceae bacterium]|nr:leukotoxin LktA family filamentous adhesin [Planctomycetaceae bacterium]